MKKQRHPPGTSVSASDFRSHLFEHLGSAAAGHPVSIRYKGREYQITALHTRTKLERFYSSGKPEPVIGDGDDTSFSDDVELKQERERDWVSKWNRRLQNL